MKIKYLWLSFFLGLTSCSTNISSFIEVVDSELKIQSVVYLYRSDSMSNIMISPEIYMDKTKIIEAKNNTYVYHIISPGQHVLSLADSEKYSGQHKMGFNIEVGEVKYFKISTWLKFRMNQPYERGFNIENVASDQAKLDMEKLKFLGEVSDFNIKVDSGNEKDGHAPDNAQFSIMKTKNPFSKSNSN